MSLSKTIRNGLLIVILVMGFLFSAAACGGPSASDDEAVPTPTPELSLDELLSKLGGNLTGMETMRFDLVDEHESGAPFFGMTLKSLEGEIKAPASFRMAVKVKTTGVAFVEIGMLAVGDEAFMKFSEDAPWAPLPLDQVPFNFAGLGPTLSDLLPIIKDTTIAGRELIEGDQTIRLDGNVQSEDLSDLITTVDAGHRVDLTLWIDEDEINLRQLRSSGQIYDDDGPETSRLLSITGIDQPVEIELPDVASSP